MQTTQANAQMPASTAAGRNVHGQFAKGRRGVDRAGDALMRRLDWEKAHPAQAATENARWLMRNVIQYGVRDTVPGGKRRVYAQPVGGAAARAQVSAWQGSLVVGFILTGKDGGTKTRLLLVTPDEDGRPDYWLHLPETGELFRHGGKYADAARLVIAQRAFERDGGTAESAQAQPLPLAA